MTTEFTVTVVEEDPSRVTIRYGDYEINIRQRRFSYRDRKQFDSRTRAYVDYGTYDLGESPTYGSVRGDGSAEDKAWRVFNRLENKTMRKMLVDVQPALDVVLSPQPVKWTFSRNAGCSMCPCSPGFKADHRLYRNGLPVDIWVSYKPVEKRAVAIAVTPGYEEPAAAEPTLTCASCGYPVTECDQHPELHPASKPPIHLRAGKLDTEPVARTACNLTVPASQASGDPFDVNCGGCAAQL